MEEKNYDMIIIGSGMGALTVASLMARIRNWRVLVLERHFKAGGYTHDFKRKGKYHWDVGIHYVGQMQERSLSRKLFDELTLGKVKWQKMADPFEKFVYPDLTFEVHSDPKKYLADLIALFPDEADSLEQYFKDIRTFAKWFTMQFTMKGLPPHLAKADAKLDIAGMSSVFSTTGEYLDYRFKNDRLKAVLASQWGDYGLPPSQSIFALHALIVDHYLEGGYYPVGGAGNIARSIQPIIEEHGGDLLLYHEVEEILLEGNRAVGVRAVKKKGKERIPKEFHAPVVVSCAGALNTYLKFLPSTVNVPFREELQSFPFATSNVTLYVGLRDDPRKIGMNGSNYWIYNSYDHNENHARRNELMDGKPSGCYVSFPSLKNPEATSHTAEIISFVDYEPFVKWKDEAWKKRGGDYDALKARISESLLAKVEGHCPGFRDLVDFFELSTPLSNEFFTDHRRGSIYGMPCLPDRFRAEWLGVETPVENLYLTGVDASSPGVLGAMMGGFATAGVLLEAQSIRSILKLLRSGGKGREVS